KRFTVSSLLLIGILNSGFAEEVEGIILPRDNSGMYVRNAEGQFEIEWTSETRIALMTNTRQFAKGLTPGKLDYKIHSSKEVVTFSIPPGPIKGVKTTKGGKHLDTALDEVTTESWIAEHGLALYFNETPEKEQLPSQDDPRFVGVWNPSESPRTLSINGQKYEISLKKGGQATIPLYGILTVEDLKPFINRALVIGKRKENVLIAEEIRMTPIGDQASHDDPDLPRYLFIGDSISGNYSEGLYEALEGKFNLHHPPTNCGPAESGARNIVAWLGAYDQPGRHWDVISFNHGHWDAGKSKESYQSSLEQIITELKKTGARLIWVTTCPVPNGYPVAGPLDENGKAPGRLAGVMEKYLNPWAAEVMARHPDIAICDQWKFVEGNANGIFSDWWSGKNVHFNGAPANALGRFLADTVIEVTTGNAANPPSVSSPPAATTSLAGLENIPMYKKDFEYTGKKSYGLYDEEDAALALVDAWKGLERLTQGFPDSLSRSMEPAGIIPDGDGGSFDITQPPAEEVLAQLKTDYQEGYGLGWYFLPKESRYREGPGLLGEEFLSDLESGKFVQGKHVAFIYGYFFQNVTELYKMYRASEDPWYVDQIVKYAEAIEWILANEPQFLIPEERRGEPIADSLATIPHEPAAVANFWAPVNAARLLLERARNRGAKPEDPDVIQAKQFLGMSVQYVASQVTADYFDLSLKRGEEPQPFQPGPNTLALREKFGIPARAAQIIEYTPWNQTFFYFATLTGAAKALEDLQAIEGGSAYANYIKVYRDVVRAGMWSLQVENICVVREGIPYFFHMHTPMRDKEPKTRLGFPIFSGEDIGHSGSGAWNLPYIWEAGEEFGVSPALLAGYCNAMVVTMGDTSMTDKKGNPVPRVHLDSPWNLAASGRTNFPWKGHKGRYYSMITFAPDIVAANRPYPTKSPIWETPGHIERLWSGHLHRVWMSRRSE
ncbi:MAG: SGNH/GDSL hydrolase family protein, partial [Verrucomicrobiota bacterium]